MIKKWIAVFFIFFLGVSGLIAVDQACRESTGAGGELGLSIARTGQGDLSVSFFGLEGRIPL